MNNAAIKFTVTIEKRGINGCGAYDTAGSTLGIKAFDTKKEANKYIRGLVKNEGYKRGYEIYNLDLGTELRTNF